MQNFKLFVELTRLNRPIGYMLLFWPCLWGLTIAHDFISDLEIYYFYSFLFLMGSMLMRSAGCIVNDIVDRNFDKRVERTKTRPIAAGKIHTDFEKGFIRAETISYTDYLDCEGELKAKELGKMRSEGKDYVVQDGDVMHFLFNN